VTERVRIVNPDHPHYPETGHWTGEVIRVIGVRMGKITLDACAHGAKACYVRPGDIERCLPTRVLA